MANPASRQQWIYDELVKTPVLSYMQMWSKYGVKWSKQESTFAKDWKIAHQRFQEYQRKANEAKDAAYIENELKGLERGVKTKTQRVLILQKQVSECIFELEQGVSASGVELDTYEKVALRKTIRELQAEISKIEGDYAATKQEVNISGYDIIIPGDEEAED